MGGNLFFFFSFLRSGAGGREQGVGQNIIRYVSDAVSFVFLALKYLLRPHRFLAIISCLCDCELSLVTSFIFLNYYKNDFSVFVEIILRMAFYFSGFYRRVNAVESLTN